jgi:hypothetical protein
MSDKYPFFDINSMSFDESKRPKKKIVEIKAEDLISNKINIREMMLKAEKENFVIRIINSKLIHESGNKKILDDILKMGLEIEAAIQLDDNSISGYNRLAVKGIVHDPEGLKEVIKDQKKSNN